MKLKTTGDMRKFIFVAMLAAAASGAVSCGGRVGKGDGKGSGSSDAGSQDGIVSAVFSLSYEAPEDVLKIADIAVEYTDAHGTVHNESLVSGTWNLKTVADEFPATVIFRPVFTLREGAVDGDGTLRLDRGGYSVKITMTDAAGNEKVYAGGSPGESLAVKADKVSAWIDRQNTRPAHSYTVDASGNVNASTSSSEGGE